MQTTESWGYLEFLNLMANARLALTDSGGIQEETTILGVSFDSPSTKLRTRLRAGPSTRSGQALRHAQGRPCLTLWERTERPVTVTQGMNMIVGCDPQWGVQRRVGP